MKPTEFIVENSLIAQEADEMHRDHEVQMARADCYNAANYAIGLHKLLKHISEAEGLEGWVSEKITLANDYLRTVYEYLKHEEAEGTEIMQFSEAAASYALDSLIEGKSKKVKEQDTNPADLSGTGYQQGNSIVKAAPGQIQKDVQASNLIGGTLQNIQSLRQGGTNTMAQVNPAVQSGIAGMQQSQQDVSKRLAVAGVGQTAQVTKPQQPAQNINQTYKPTDDIEEASKSAKNKKLKEMATGGASSAGGVATSIGGPAHKKTSGVPKRVGNSYKQKTIPIGKGVYDK